MDFRMHFGEVFFPDTPVLHEAGQFDLATNNSIVNAKFIKLIEDTGTPIRITIGRRATNTDMYAAKLKSVYAIDVLDILKVHGDADYIRHKIAIVLLEECIKYVPDMKVVLYRH